MLKQKRQGSAAKPVTIASGSDNDASNADPADYDDDKATGDLKQDVTYPDFGGGEDDFIDDENADDEAAAIPIEFTLRTMKPRELFRYAVKWMVQKKINPDFALDDEIYNITFSRLNDFVKGMGGSKYLSSAWTATFTRAIQARPELEANHFAATDFLHDRCDACNRSAHPATYEVRFLGLAYNKRSLEVYSDDEVDDPTRETALPSQDETFYVGK